MDERKPYKVFSKDQLLHDPVMFGSLMEFQYGPQDEVAGEAQRLLFEEESGIVVQNFRELSIVINNLDFWEHFGEEEEPQPQRYRLYANERPASLLGANLLAMARVNFELRKTDAPVLNVGRERSPLPILVDLEWGAPYSTLSAVRRFARGRILENLGGKETLARYFPSSAYSENEACVFYPKVLCFGPDGKAMFRGNIEDSPLPIKEALIWSSYGERTQGKGFHHVYGWNLGELSKIISQTNGKGFISLPDAPALLFFDEIETFKQGVDRLILGDSVNLMGASYEAYFVRDKQLYRVYAYMSD